MSSLLGLDLGTSSVKALLVDSSGKTLGSGSAEYPIQQPRPNHAEQDPEAWWRAVVSAVRQALSGGGSREAVAAVGISGQMHGTVLIDRQLRLLAHAVIWPDQRSARQVAEITQTIGAERLIEIAGSPVATGFQAATLRWFQQERPDLWKQVGKALLPKDYLRWRLTGALASDPSDGSGALLLDIHQRQWAPEILDALGIPIEFLPALQPSEAIAGELRPEAAGALGLPAGLPVITGAADTACSLLGAGVTSPDTLLVNISTGGQLILPDFSVAIDTAGRMHTFCSALQPGADQAGWYKMGATLSAGQSLRWLRDNVLGFTGEDAYPRMTALAEKVPLGARGLIFLPYLVGERTPLMDPQARGLFLGLTLRHGQGELVRAVLEGVTLSLSEAYSVMIETSDPPETLILAGGGAHSRLWQHIVADVFGLPVQRLKVSEQSAAGAALLAGAGIGLLEPLAASRAWARYDLPVEPDPKNHARYQELLGLFRNAYQVHRQDFKKLEGFPG
jgi:xylulokinase